MPPSAGLRIVGVEAVATYALRQRVLRPHQSVAEVAFPGDEDSETGHFAAFDPTGQVIGVVSVLHQATPALPAAVADDSWRLRGMATAEAHRGRGLGSALLEAAWEHVVAHGATVLWCHARMTAAGFYLREGFAAIGEPWEEPRLGAHVVMWRPVPSGSG